MIRHHIRRLGKLGVAVIPRAPPPQPTLLLHATELESSTRVFSEEKEKDSSCGEMTSRNRAEAYPAVCAIGRIKTTLRPGGFLYAGPLGVIYRALGDTQTRPYVITEAVLPILFE
jgi:hypothetical protein